MLGETLGGRYVLSGLLGCGGMAEVFLARDRMLGRDVALKVLRERHAEDERFVGRFLEEARCAASLDHPGVVRVYDQGRAADGRYFIAMEHAAGGSLKNLIARRRGPLDPAEAARLASQVAEALGAAHERGIVHRDIKPQNVLIGEAGEAKVADFGIALAASGGTTSGTDLLFGTPGYMSPEQAMGERVGPQSDLYSLGVVLYEMLTGELPFEAEGALATAMKHITERPVPPRERDPRVPEAMEALVMALLAKDPEDRYGSAFELAEDLRRARAGLPLAFVAGAGGRLETPRATAGTEGGARSEDPGSEPRRRKRTVAIGLLALAALLALGTIGWGLTGSREGPKGTGGAVAASEGNREGGAPAAPEGSGGAREGATGGHLGGRYVPASPSATPSASTPASVPPASASASASASTPASAPLESAPASASASASATPEARASEPTAAGPSGAAASASGGQDAGTRSTVVVESVAQEQYR
jgi:hypothetical protein